MTQMMLQSLSDNYVDAILEDQDFNLWVGTEIGGLNLLDRATGKFTHYRKNDKDPSSIGDDHVSVILEGEKNELWIGSGTEGWHKQNGSKIQEIQALSSRTSSI